MVSKLTRPVLCLLFVVFGIVQKSWAADCSSVDIELSNQEAIDNFQTTYGGGGVCDTVTGTLTVTGEYSSSTVITNIDGLLDLTRIEGDLRVRSNYHLANLDGLANLTSVGGNLDLSRNANLTNVDALNRISGAIGELWVSENYRLANIDGLANLTSVQSLYINDNDDLINIDGLENVTGSVRNIYITNNFALADIDGLARLSNVEWQVRLTGNNALIDTDGLASLTNAGEAITINLNSALTNLDGLARLTSAGSLEVINNQSLAQCGGLLRLLDQWDDAEPGPGPGYSGVPDVAQRVDLGANLSGCNSIEETLEGVDTSRINPGLNDHWYNPATDGQGVYITVLPDMGKITLTMFRYDTILPPLDATAILGDPSQRWLNALGRYSGNEAVMNVSFDYDGVFDSPEETTKVRDYGTIILSFSSCNSGTLEYDIPALDLTGIIPIQRIAGDNIALCEALNLY